MTTVAPVTPPSPVAGAAPGIAGNRGASPAAVATATKTAEAFEAVLIGQMTQLMMASTGEAGEFSGGHGEEMFRGILAEKIGTEIARHGGLGLAPAIMQQIIELQGTSK